MNKVYLLLISILSSCYRPGNTLETTFRDKPAKGELHFLLDYNHRMPEDVGFLTNHVVERRMANLLKGDFEFFMAHTTYPNLIMADTLNDIVVATFRGDSLSQKLVATVLIDVAKDAFWVDFNRGDSMISYADYPNSEKPLFYTAKNNH